MQKSMRDYILYYGYPHLDPTTTQTLPTVANNVILFALTNSVPLRVDKQIASKAPSEPSFLRASVARRHGVPRARRPYRLHLAQDGSLERSLIDLRYRHREISLFVCLYFLPAHMIYKDCNLCPIKLDSAYLGARFRPRRAYLQQWIGSLFTGSAC